MALSIKAKVSTMKFKVDVTIPSADVLEKQAWEAVKKGLESRLSSVVCPVHHEHPRIKVSGSLKNPNVRVEGCCQKLIDQAKAALQR